MTVDFLVLSDIRKAPSYLRIPAHNTFSYFTNLHHVFSTQKGRKNIKSIQQDAKAKSISYSLNRLHMLYWLQFGNTILQAAVNPPSCAPWNQPQSPAKGCKCPKDDAQTENKGIWHQKKANIACYVEPMHTEALEGCAAVWPWYNITTTWYGMTGSNQNRGGFQRSMSSQYSVQESV